MVGDNGIGIQTEYVNRVTEMFFRGSEQSKGNGLGLYVVSKATTKLLGHLTIESTFQVGTTIRCWFPLNLVLRASLT